MVKLEEVDGPVVRRRRRRWFPDLGQLVTIVLLLAAVFLLAVIARQGGRPPEWPLDTPCQTLTFYEGGAGFGPGPTSDISARLCPIVTTSAPTEDG